MGKLLDGYRTTLRTAHPLRLSEADRMGRWVVYKTLHRRYGPERFLRHMKAVRNVLDRAYTEAA